MIFLTPQNRINDNYVTLNGIIRQSNYCQQLPDLVVSCDELDGLPENIPVIFEDNYVLSPQGSLANYSPSSSTSSNLSSSDSFTKQSKMSVFQRSFNSKSKSDASNKEKEFASNKELDQQQRAVSISISSNEYSSSSLQMSDSNKQLHKKLKKKVHGDSFDQIEKNKSIQLVSYRKVNTDFELEFMSTATSSSTSEGSTSSVGTESTTLTATTTTTTVQSKLNKIKAELASRGSTPASVHRSQNLHSITESKVFSQACTATDLLKRNLTKHNTELFLKQQTVDLSNMLGRSHMMDEKAKLNCKSLTNLTDPNEFVEQGAVFGSADDKESSFNSESFIGPALDLTDPTSELTDQTLDLDEVAICLDESKDELNAAAASMDKNDRPSDCGFKSRALYESFRGKPSTLERPRQRQRLVNPSKPSLFFFT